VIDEGLVIEPGDLIKPPSAHHLDRVACPDGEIWLPLTHRTAAGQQGRDIARAQPANLLA